MAIVGFHFSGIEAYKKVTKLTGKVDVNNNITVKDVKAMEVNLGTDDSKGLFIGFEYICDYEPGVGSIKFTGHVVTVEKPEDITKSLNSWKKEKKLAPDLTEQVMSYVLTKCTVQSIIMSREVGLPAPIPLPKIEGKAPAKKK